MPVYSYRARNRNGELVTGRLEAPDVSTLEESLDRMGLIPIKVTSHRTGLDISLSGIERFLKLGRRITDQDLILFSRQLATLFAAGVPLTKALSALEHQMENPEFVKVIRGVREDIEGGGNFASAIGRHSQVFPELYVSMIEAGEAGGILDIVLDRLAYMLEKNAENRAKVKSATLYPKIVIGAIIIAVVILMNFVVPKFAKLYASFKVPLPLPTRILIALSNAFVNYWYLLAGGIVGVILLVRFYISTERGRYHWDRLMLKVPIFGPLRLKAILSRFARVLGSLYRSGLPMLQSLDIVSRAVENRVISMAVKMIEDDVRAGKDLSESMEKTHAFPPMVIQMVNVGEETGNLDDMLEKVAQYYDQEVDSTIRNLTTILEPILLTIIFGMVLFLALAIFLPMWDLLTIIRR